MCESKFRNHYIFFFLSTCLAIIFLLNGCFKSIPYESEQLESFFDRKENIQLAFVCFKGKLDIFFAVKKNIQLTFETDKGKQVAFYVPPLLRPGFIPEKIAILYPGINAVALGWLNYIRLEDDPEAGYLLIDYPGHGLSQGLMNPEKNYKNTEGALKALAEHFDIEKVVTEFCLMGHSFGTGAALQYAATHKVSRIVLVAPFDTLRNAVAQRSAILAVLMPAQIDNEKLIKKVLASDEKPSIAIIHGDKDTSLPVEMGRKLADANSEYVQYYEIPQGDHTSLLTTHRDLIFHALLGTKPNEFK